MTGSEADEERTGEAAADLRARIVAQFSGAGESAAVWRALDRFLPTREYLNLGYSPRYLPTVVGDSQARLAGRLAAGLAERVTQPAGSRLLDVGCGRGGPARQFAARGFAVTGVDLVPYNVALAREAAGEGERSTPASAPAFVVGDATVLPFPEDAFAACAAVDALVYLPEERAAFGEVARVLEPGGWFAAADLLAGEAAEGGAEDALTMFSEAWDMAPLVPTDTYRARLRAAGFTDLTVDDITPNSTGRFRTWSRGFLALADGPTGGALRRLLEQWNVEPEPVIRQVRAAHRALPYLKHVIVYART